MNFTFCFLKILLSSLQTFLENVFGALIPVPIAVPPIGKYRHSFLLDSNESFAWTSCSLQDSISYPKVNGTASIRCVLPVLIISLYSHSLSIIFITRKSITALSSDASKTDDILIAEGITSFELWDIFTSSLGCTLVLDFLDARVERTSFIFIFVLVPDPV